MLNWIFTIKERGSDPKEQQKKNREIVFLNLRLSG